MRVLVDTNIFTRVANPGHPYHAAALNSLAEIKDRRHVPCVVSQVLYEFWVVATRPPGENGLGMSVSEARTDVERIVSKCQFIEDERTVFRRWQSLVSEYRVIGRTAHAAHLVATMKWHGIGHVLTFDGLHFAEFGVRVIDPENMQL